MEARLGRPATRLVESVSRGVSLAVRSRRLDQWGGRPVSLYQVQQCLFDYLRAMEGAPPGSDRPDIDIEGYDLSPEEQKALTTGDVRAFHVMGVHPVIINGYCRAMGYKRADYRPLLAEAASEPRRTRWRTS
jgi:hypothetical protein